ncbi:MAG: 16S rRNA (guanine(966)-N(2))-methyltransferase RsmD [Calditrichaceae bacterium]
MRIISGIYKGRRLKSSNDLSIRPTTDRVKEDIFNILQDFPYGKIVIDLFAGSGNLGLEALSRGAEKIYFVEKAPTSIKILTSNLEHLKISQDQHEIIRSDAIDFANTTGLSVDLCLMDPPFVYPQIQELVDTVFIRNVISPGGLLVLEHEITNPIMPESSDYNILKQKRVGRSLLSFLEKRQINE